MQNLIIKQKRGSKVTSNIAEAEEQSEMQADSPEISIGGQLIYSVACRLNLLLLCWYEVQSQ